MSWLTSFAIQAVVALLVAVAFDAALYFLPRKTSEPPAISHWIPWIGSAVSYGRNPCRFLMDCQKKHGDIFTFTILGRKTTVYLGPAGNDFILNGKLNDLNAEEIYGPICTPVFGTGVVYDCPNAKFMEQKKFVKFGLTHAALESHVRLMEREVLDYIGSEPAFDGQRGILDVPLVTGQITIFTAGRSLQGAEVRKKLTGEFAKLYHDLDMGFQPINYVIPWAPLPQNRRRDAAHARMREVYMEIIKERRTYDVKEEEEEPDMLWNLMRCVYKDGQPIPDKEIAHLMITLLFGGQHSSASTSAWIVLHLASRPSITEELYQEQVRNFGTGTDEHGVMEFRPIQHADIATHMPLMQAVLKETLRIHSPIHSIMRKAMNDIPVPGSQYVIPAGRTMLASPGVMHQHPDYYPNPDEWDPHRWAGDRSAAGEDERNTVGYGLDAVSKGAKSTFLPFGAGRHRCIGESFAYVNICTIMATLVRNFRFATLDGRATLPSTDFTSMLPAPSHPAVVRWERRS